MRFDDDDVLCKVSFFPFFFVVFISPPASSFLFCVREKN